MSDRRVIGDPNDFLTDTRKPLKGEPWRVEDTVYRKPPVEKKLCLKCDKILPLEKFYANSLWTEQNGRDSWCKDCVQSHCNDEVTLREYCFYNNRRYSPAHFEEAKVKAKYYLNSDKEYLNPRTTKRRREEMIDKEATRQFFAVMNLKTYYSYFANVRNDLPIPAFHADNQDGMKIPAPTEKEDDVLVYDSEWFGHYTKGDLRYLNDYYQKLTESFEINDPSRVDYARKMCRASLEADKAFNAYREGTGNRQDWEKALAVYDMLNKSAAFAASSKKKDVSIVDSIDSLSELILAIEQTGALLPVEPDYFPDDNVDKVYKQFLHTMKAIKGTD